jgi:hypothetical protein
MAPSAISPLQTSDGPPVKICHSKNGKGDNNATVERTLSAIEQHVSDLAKDAAVKLDPNYKITEEPIGTRRAIRVACIGAGYSGLMMAIMFSQKMKGKKAELVVYERNQDLGGTWLLNRYPGKKNIIQSSYENGRFFNTK